jgi:hypothetical protein
MGHSVESRWWNSSVSVQFKRQVNALWVNHIMLTSVELTFVTQMKQLTERNDDMAELGMSEWIPSAKQINYVQGLYQQYCTEAMDQ